MPVKKYENLAKSIYDIGKYSFITLILSQFVSKSFNLIATVTGITLTASAFIIAFKFEQIKDDSK